MTLPLKTTISTNGVTKFLNQLQIRLCRLNWRIKSSNCVTLNVIQVIIKCNYFRRILDWIEKIETCGTMNKYQAVCGLMLAHQFILTTCFEPGRWVLARSARKHLCSYIWKVETLFSWCIKHTIFDISQLLPFSMSNTIFPSGIKPQKNLIRNTKFLGMMHMHFHACKILTLLCLVC